VIGGTGQLGALVVRQLRGDGHRVRLLVERSQQLATGMQARVCPGDLDVIRRMAAKGAPRSYRNLKDQLERGA
jgi:uncharacterized protein YbjT (DUF2867 family)